MHQTFGTALRAHQGIGPGFNFMRLFLALCVMLVHSCQISYGKSWNAGPFDLPEMLIVPAFFALSGFLVAGSMRRTPNVAHFLALRALRIVPALFIEVTLSALLLGPLITTLPLSQYATNPAFFSYFANIVGYIHYHLPGVFAQNPLAGIVNGQLWTIPAELHCYLLLAALMLLRLATKPRLMCAIFATLALAETLTALLPNHHYTSHVLNAPEMLVLCFLCGAIFYLWQSHIPRHPALFAAAAALFAAIGLWCPTLSFTLGTLTACYMIIFLGTRPLPHIPLLMKGDYSYGIYLYSFPLQQLIAWALPQHRIWWLNLLLSLPLTYLCAALSWHLLEKPALSLRKYL